MRCVKSFEWAYFEIYCWSFCGLIEYILNLYFVFVELFPNRLDIFLWAIIATYNSRCFSMWGMRSWLMKWIRLNYLSQKASGGLNHCMHLLGRKMKPPHSPDWMDIIRPLLWMWCECLAIVARSLFSVPLITNESPFLGNVVAQSRSIENH